MIYNSELKLILHVLQNKISATTLDTALFYKLVLRHRVWHQVNNAVKHNIAALTTHCQNDTLRILVTASETVRIARELSKHNIEHCFIKGILLNVHVYGGLITRPCRDIDIWVNADVYAKAVNVLLALGYQQKLPKYELQGFKERWYLQHKHDMAFYHSKHNILVELHFCLNYLGMEFFSMSEVTRSTIKLFNTPIMTLDDNYHVLYLMIHGAIHAWIRLRWLQDIALFIGNNQCDLRRVYALARQLNCQHIVEQTLILVHNILKLNHAELINYVQKPSRRATKLADIASQFITADYEMNDSLKNIKMFLKYRFYLARLTVRGRKCHAILGDWFKIDEVFVYTTFPDKLAFMYYIIYPLWVIRFIFKK